MADKEKDNKSLMDSIKLIVGKEDKLNDQLKKDQGLEGYAKDLLLLMSLVKDYYQGNYRNIPYKTISAAVVGLLYVLNPIDIIPDFIPFIGHIDDALVLKFCLKMIDKDLTKYKKWKDEQTATKDKSVVDTDKDSKPTFKKLDKEQSSKDK
ncbi:YkvA family protein [Psychrobacter celer]|uniref:YkvA family protein n=1 Tax=Psychrobacter celer TaxID=306572 RepID=UPI002FE4EBA7